MNEEIKLTLRKSILAGAAIALGCSAFCACDNKYIGAFLFSIGLCTICGKKWLLFTGALCRCEKTVKELALIFVGNLLGSALVFFLCLPLPLMQTAADIGSAKTAKGLSEIFVSAVLCEICIYIAVTAYKERMTALGKYIGIVLGVMVFILCGYEHCVADMFYALSCPTSKAGLAACLVIITAAGNVAGAALMNALDPKPQ